MRSRFLWAGLVIVAAVGYLAYTGWQGATLYYLTASEASGQMGSLAERGFRLSGQVAEGSVAWDPGTSELRFDVTDGQASVAVLYRGAAPDSFAAGRTVVAEGVADGRGGMTADRIIVKCPSKYEDATAVGDGTQDQNHNSLLLGVGVLVVAVACVAVAGRLVLKAGRSGRTGRRESWE